MNFLFHIIYLQISKTLFLAHFGDFSTVTLHSNLKLSQTFSFQDKILIKEINPLSANLTKWSNTQKQFVSNLPSNCLSVFDHYVELALNGLKLVDSLYNSEGFTCDFFIYRASTVLRKSVYPNKTRALLFILLNEQETSKGHSSQIQQGSGIDVVKSSSSFYHLIVSMREVLPENFSFIAQFSLTLWLFKVSGLQISLIFKDSYIQIAFAVSLTGAIS